MSIWQRTPDLAALNATLKGNIGELLISVSTTSAMTG